jgi:NMD protein affecting ribosome stability and mRNA decay
MPQRLSSRRALGLLALLLIVPLAVLGLTGSPASAAVISNATFRVPASVQVNPCFPGDVVNLHGTIHVVTASTADGSGGYHMTQTLNSKLGGLSITTRTKYVNSENKNDSWYAGTPFPAIQTHTYDFTLVAQSKTPNYVLHMTMHTTVNSKGVPTAVVDNWRADCQG